MKRARLAVALALALAGLPALVAAQLPQLLQERMLPQQVEPGVVEAFRPLPGAAADVGETTMLHTPHAGPTIAEWYARQGRPAVVLFFDRRLERLPPGWDGTARVMIASERQAAGKTETENLSIALERKAPTRSVRGRSPVVVLVENSLTRELQRMRFKLVDPTIAERALSTTARSGSDTEFQSLKGAAGYVLEVELAATGGAVSMIGGLKHIASGEIVATVRAPVERDLNEPAAADALARSFIKRLLAHQAAT